MLKRYQIIMDDWLADYWKEISVRMDVSFSEMIRLALCKHIMDVTEFAFPKHPGKVDEKMFKEIVKSRSVAKGFASEDLHRYMSQLYFEARKACEVWMQAKGAETE